jgi:hypothetical protein
MTTKDRVLKLIKKLPDEATLEDIQYHLYVLQLIEGGEESLKHAPSTPNEEVMRKVAEWIK